MPPAGLDPLEAMEAMSKDGAASAAALLMPWPPLTAPFCSIVLRIPVLPWNGGQSPSSPCGEATSCPPPVPSLPFRAHSGPIPPIPSRSTFEQQSGLHAMFAQTGSLRQQSYASLLQALVCPVIRQCTLFTSNRCTYQAAEAPFLPLDYIRYSSTFPAHRHPPL